MHMRKTIMNTRQLAKLFWATKAALIAILLYIALEAVIAPSQPGEKFRPKAVAGGERPLNDIQQATKPAARPDYSVILDQDVFNGAGSTATQDIAPADTSNAASLPSAEELGLILTGIVAGGPTTSRAIIEDGTAKVATPYKIGDRVGPATIESIEPDHVILLHNGRRAVLQMHSGNPAKGQESPVKTEKLEVMASEPTVVDRQEPRPSARLGYVEELFHKATIKPYLKDGRTEGLEITGLEETPLTKLFGLRNGDIVQNVNGQDINSKQKAFQVLKKARTQSRIDLRLLRDGDVKELSFDL